MNIKGLFLLACCCLISFCQESRANGISKIKPEKLTCEYLENPQVIDVSNPRLSWINRAQSGLRGQYQTACQIQVASSYEKLLKGVADLWDSKMIKSSQSTLINYQGAKLKSAQGCWWRVRVWDAQGQVSSWSQTAFWNMGLLSPEDWTAKWIGAPWQGEEPLSKTSAELPPPAPLLHKAFKITKQIASARIFVTGLGYFELYLNGRKVGNDLLVPNLTAYEKRPDIEKYGINVTDNFKEFRSLYLSYDLTKQLRKGENVLGAILGNGFFNVAVNWTMPFGSPRFLAQLQITYTDGTKETIASDESWKAHKSAITMDQIYAGESYDARLEIPNWCSPGFNDSDWQPVAIRKAPQGKLMAQMSHSDRVMQRLKPLKIEKLGEGHYKVDFGQEVAGWLHLMNVRGERGHRIDIKYLCESPNGANSYIMKGGAPESYSARFTWFVSRAVEITNWPGTLNANQVEMDAVYTQNETTGHFKCSNELFNKINQIWWRSQSDNMHGGVASDCPHRERSSYTGDGQASCVTVMHNFDVAAFYTKWIRDIVGAQDPSTGYVPNAAPFQPGCGGGVAWGAAINIMPWEFYLHYGDKKMLETSFDGMKGYVDYMLKWVSPDGVMFSQLPDKAHPTYWLNLGDWCAPGQLPADSLVHTFYLWRCADFTAKAAAVLNLPADAAHYAEIAEKTRQAFHNRFYDPVKYTYGPYGGNIFALKMNLPYEGKDKVVVSLKSDIEHNNGHLDTGIFGTQFFFEVLAENGLNDLAYEAMNKRDKPSYGYWIEQGSTTTWEEWGGNNSHNHPMFGGGLVWFYRELAGMNIDPEQPGYRHIIFRPQPVGSISFASYSNQTLYGPAAIDWKKNDGKFLMTVTVPVGSTATVYVPVVKGTNIKEGGLPVKKVKDVISKGIAGGYAVFEVNSGNYHFEAN